MTVDHLERHDSPVIGRRPDRAGPAAFPFEATHYVWRESAVGTTSSLTPVVVVDRWAYTEREWNAGGEPGYVAGWSEWRDRAGARVQQRLLDPHREGQFAWENQPAVYRSWLFPHERTDKTAFLVTHRVQSSPQSPVEDVMAIEGVAYTRGAWDWNEPPEFLVGVDTTLTEFPDASSLARDVRCEVLPDRYAVWVDDDGIARLSSADANGVRELVDFVARGPAPAHSALTPHALADEVLRDSGWQGSPPVAETVYDRIVARLQPLSAAGPLFLSRDTVRAWMYQGGNVNVQLPLTQSEPFIPTHQLTQHLSSGEPVAVPVMVCSDLGGVRRAYTVEQWRAVEDAYRRGQIPQASAEYDASRGVWRPCTANAAEAECAMESFAPRLVGWTGDYNVRQVFHCRDDGIIQVWDGIRLLDWSTNEGRKTLARYAAQMVGIDVAREGWRVLAIDAELAEINPICWQRSADEIRQWAEVPPRAQADIEAFDSTSPQPGVGSAMLSPAASGVELPADSAMGVIG